MNSVNIVGRLCQSPELRQTQKGIEVCSFTCAVKRPGSKDTTDFLSCVSWRQTAQLLCKFTKKGSLIGVSGILTSRKYEGKEGDSKTIYEIQVDKVTFLDPKDKDTEPHLQSFMEFTDMEDEDLPF